LPGLEYDRYIIGLLTSDTARSLRRRSPAKPLDKYFSDGLTVELTNAVAHLDGLRVVAHTTAFQFNRKARDVADCHAAARSLLAP
jgi:hypothetical protein